MEIYPYNYPIILSDTVFVDYGGKTGTFTPAQRTSAYMIAERQATSYIGAYLLPTTTTGTYPYLGNNRVGTEFGYVHEILDVVVLSKKNTLSCDLQSDDGCAFIYEDTFGYLDVRRITNTNVCGCNGDLPYQFRITYNSGLPTGVATNPGVLLALTIAAQTVLNEIDPGNAGMNEGVGDVGIREFTSMDYSEKRNKLGNSAFGNSAKANYCRTLIDSVVKKARKSLRL
jgi:hypothetical protein